MLKVKLLTGRAGNDPKTGKEFVQNPGEVVSMPDAEAERYVQKELAAPAGWKPKPPPKVETAALESGEPQGPQMTQKEKARHAGVETAMLESGKPRQRAAKKESGNKKGKNK